MKGNLREKMESGRNALEKLVANLPGYQGYKEKELRREADKLLRNQLAAGFDKQRRRLSSIQYTLTTTGRLAAVVTLERAMLKLQLLVDRLKVAAYGYAGFFDAVKVEEAELDALYNFDLSLWDGVKQVEDLINELEEAASKEEDVSQSANALIKLLEELNETFNRRQDVILETSKA